MNGRRIGNRIVIIGAGPAGLLCAGTLAAAGCTVTVLERQDTPGGLMKEHEWLYPDDTNLQMVRDNAIRSGNGHPGIVMHTGITVIGISGQVGAFVVSYTGNDGAHNEISADMLVIATGYDVHDLIESGVDGLAERDTAVLVCREHNRSAFAALAARAVLLRRTAGSRVFLITPGVYVSGTGLEKLVNKAQDDGVVIIKTETGAAISTDGDGRYTVRVTDPVLGRPLLFEPDALLTGGIRQPAAGTDRLAAMLRISTGPGGYLQADNSQNGGVESGRPGIFVCGGCRLPGDWEDIVRDCGTVVAGVRTLAGSELTVDTGVCAVDEDKCRLCLTCYRTCPHAAVTIDTAAESAVIDEYVCAACGTCIGACPAGAIAEAVAEGAV